MTEWRSWAIWLPLAMCNTDKWIWSALKSPDGYSSISSWFQVANPIHIHGPYPYPVLLFTSQKVFFWSPTGLGIRLENGSASPFPVLQKREFKILFFHYQWIIPFLSSSMSLMVKNSMETGLMRYENLLNLKYDSEIQVVSMNAYDLDLLFFSGVFT